jgi:hypothetical protein
MKTVLNMAPTACPVCFTKLDAATHAGNRTPKAGSIGVCVYCTTVLRYEADLTVRQLTDKEFESLEPGFQAAIQELQDAYKKNPIRRRR